MMKKALSLLAVLILMLFLASCNTGNGDENNHNGNSNTAGNHSGKNTDEKDGSNEPDPLRIEDYYPVKKDTRYVYEGSGNEYASYVIYTDYKTEDGIR